MNEMNRQLIVMGNGFDLECGLKTKYQDFFDYRFGISLEKQIIKRINPKTDEKEVTENFDQLVKAKIRKYCTENFGSISRYVDFLGDTSDLSYTKNEKSAPSIVKQCRDMLNGYWDKLGKLITQIEDQHVQDELISKLNQIKGWQYNTWEAIFLIANTFISSKSSIQWQDVETMIFSVVTELLTDSEKSVFDRYSFAEQGDESYLLSALGNLYFKDSETDNKAIELLEELQKFESNFAKYVNKIKDDAGEKYYNNASRLFNAILNSKRATIIDVLSFNYSLDSSFIGSCKKMFDYIHDNQASLEINSWSNIHGVAAVKDEVSLDWLLSSGVKLLEKKNINIPAPIFGIDNHGILSPDNQQNGPSSEINLDDPRSIFTKSYRLIDNHVNEIRVKSFQDKVDVIIFFGHSLGHADYSYFESIFDKYDIFHSNVKLEFYYYPGNKSDEAAAKRAERKTIKNIVKLLTSYGETLEGEHGENIVNKLMLEQRLSVLPNPSFGAEENNE